MLYFRFFGVEWEGLSRKWLKTVTAIHQLLGALDTKTIDILIFNEIITDISKVEAEISLHTEAVLSGRLSEEDQKRQYQQQQQFLVVPVDRGGGSKERKRRTSKEVSGRYSSSPIQRSKSVREKFGLNKEKGTNLRMDLVS